MSGPWLAQTGMDDWVEWLVPAVVIVLAVLGNITKALSKSKAQKERKRQTSPPPVHRRHAPPVPPRPVARPAPVRPVAKPLPPRERERITRTSTTTPPQRPTRHVESLPDLLKEVFGQLRESASQPAPPPKKSPPRPTVAAPARRRKERRRSPAPKTEHATAPPPVPVEPVDLRQRHLGHLEGGIAAGIEAEVDAFADTLSELDAVREEVRHPHRADLRRAIVMNEILSPPLALRDIEEPWS